MKPITKLSFIFQYDYRTFSTSDTESMYTQETKQFYFKPESDFWMVLVSLYLFCLNINSS